MFLAASNKCSAPGVEKRIPQSNKGLFLRSKTYQKIRQYCIENQQDFSAAMVSSEKKYIAKFNKRTFYLCLDASKLRKFANIVNDKPFL